MAPLILVGVPAVHDDAALDEVAEVPCQHRCQLRGELVTKRGHTGAGGERGEEEQAGSPSVGLEKGRCALTVPGEMYFKPGSFPSTVGRR